jgi:hypothetical protein
MPSNWQIISFLSFVSVPQDTVIRNIELVWHILRHYRGILVYLGTMAQSLAPSPPKIQKCLKHLCKLSGECSIGQAVKRIKNGPESCHFQILIGFLSSHLVTTNIRKSPVCCVGHTL